MERFSKRRGYTRDTPEITIREDAPAELRDVVVTIAYEAGLDPHDVRSVVCRVLRRREDPNNWSAFPNVDCEARSHLDSCDWYEVYDVIEALHDQLDEKAGFESEINDYFARRGIGWQLVGGTLQLRGEEDFEETVRSATAELNESSRPTAAQELHEALMDLSRRPSPDVTGGIQHALAALECVARDVAGNAKGTLGSILKSNPGLVPPPLDMAIEKLWGYASEQGRHLREGRGPSWEEATLCVHVSSAVSLYLSKKARRS